MKAAAGAVEFGAAVVDVLLNRKEETVEERWIPFDVFLEFTDGADPQSSEAKDVDGGKSAAAREVVEHIETLGFEVTKVKPSKKGRCAFALRAKYSMLLKEAEKKQMRKELKRSSPGGKRTSTFFTAITSEFKDSDNPAKFFSSGERLMILEDVLFQDNIIKRAMGKVVMADLMAASANSGSKTPEEGDSPKASNASNASTLLKMFERSSHQPRVIAKLIPLHSAAEAESLANGWIRSLWFQPLDQIKDYLGEQRAFYFAFLGTYTYWLVVPTLIGMYVFHRQNNSELGLSDPSGLYFGIFLTVWATLFLEYWKRKQSSLAFEWDSIEFEANEEEDRQEYREKATLKYNESADALHWTYPGYKRGLAYVFSFVVCTLFCSFATSIMVYFFSLGETAAKEWVGDEWKGAWSTAKFIPVAIYFGSMTVFSSINNVLAEFLTSLENHRTDSEHRNSLVIKLVLLQFFVYFIALFFIAFVERDVNKLYSNVASLLGIYQVINQIIESGLPLTHAILGAVKVVRNSGKEEPATKHSLKKSSSSESSDDGLPPVGETDLLLPDVEDLFPDYLELWIQFGQVTLFAMVFPLAPLLALLNNIMEIRMDALKMLRTQKRGIPTRASGIGSWLEIFEVMGYIAVMTNVALVGLLFHDSPIGKEYLEGLSREQKLLLLIVVEHVLIGLKFIISVMVPDVPSNIKFLLRARHKEVEIETQKDFALRAECYDRLRQDRKKFAFRNGTEQGLHLAQDALGGLDHESRRESMLVRWILDREERLRRAEKFARLGNQNQVGKPKQESLTRAEILQFANVLVFVFAFLYMLTSEARTC